MTYILDTDTLIYFLKGEGAVVEAVSRHTPSTLATTIINHSELLFGVFNSSKKKENLALIQGLFKSLPILAYCEEASFIFAEQKAQLKTQGNPIADLDLMIASITLKHKAILVTNNTKHFARVKSLNIENWR